MKTFLLLIFLLSNVHAMASDCIAALHVVHCYDLSFYGGASCSGVNVNNGWSAIVVGDSVQLVGILSSKHEQYSQLNLKKGDTIVVNHSYYTPYVNQSHISPKVDFGPSITKTGNTVFVSYSSPPFIYQPIEVEGHDLETQLPLGYTSEGKVYTLQFPFCERDVQYAP